MSGVRFPSEVETAVYFCCLEAVNNARKHAPGATIAVGVREVQSTLRFTVRDKGPGFTSQTDGAGGGPGRGGRGLRNVTARITAVGGKILIRSVPGAGTTIEGFVPLPRDARPAATVESIAVTKLRTHLPNSPCSTNCVQSSVRLKSSITGARKVDGCVRYRPS